MRHGKGCGLMRDCDRRTPWLHPRALLGKMRRRSSRISGYVCLGDDSCHLRFGQFMPFEQRSRYQLDAAPMTVDQRSSRFLACSCNAGRAHGESSLTSTPRPQASCRPAPAPRPDRPSARAGLPLPDRRRRRARPWRRRRPRQRRPADRTGRSYPSHHRPHHRIKGASRTMPGMPRGPAQEAGPVPRPGRFA